MPDQPTTRILIVDDDASSILILAKALGPEFVCEFARSGPEALSRLESTEAPDLMLLDVMMPDMDGYEVCRRIKANSRNRNLPVIFVTASNDPNSETQGLLAGAVDFIQKPIHPTVVRLRVGLHILLRQRECELQRLNAELEQRVSDRTGAIADRLEAAAAIHSDGGAWLLQRRDEIRNALNSISTLTGSLRRHEADADQQGRLDSLLAAAEDLSRLLANTLENRPVETDGAWPEARDS